MNRREELLEESLEELYEDAACGHLSCRPDGTIVRVNRTLEEWTGHRRENLIGRRFSDLLTAPGRIYHETHYAPLLRMQGAVREIAFELVRHDGSRLPALVNSVQHTDEAGNPRIVRTAVFQAGDRRRYEQELLEGRRREQHHARELQRSLLAGHVPRSPEFEIEVFYRPAVAGTEVGGDWYDAFWLDDRRVGLVIGDVVGRGIGAAATMGQLRSAVRALASTGLGPGPLLDALDRYVARHDIGRMTTVVVAALDLDTRELRYACAGHPPPVLAGPGGGARLLQDGRSVPLDAAIEPGSLPRPEGAVTLEPGARVVLYTDGLVESKARPLSVGLDRLVGEVAAADEPLSLTALVRRLQDSAPSDDVCLVGLLTRP